MLLLELGAVTRGATVVDLGAGTGQSAVAVAPHCRRVVAVDVSPAMLERLRAKADVVDSRWALHHLPDAWKVVALRRMRRTLRAGGVLRLVDLVYGFEAGVEAWCASVPATAATDGEWVRADLEEHVRDEHSTFTWLLEPMIERAGFRIERAEHGDDGVSAAYVARAV